jgi:DNA polymerase-3 subunit gamma/tau
MAYLVLARKYRSKTFDEVVGQEPIARTLVNAIRSGRIAHAYLFTGTRGVGKTTMARILAKALNCLSSDAATPEPCNTCDACVAIARGDDIDVVEIDGASNRGIDEIRDLRANAIFHPARCRYKVYYIDEVHQITRDAFNALLKTLEEPPGHVKFIFSTTEAGKVPPTILSRCQRFDFRNIPTRLISQHLRRICEAEKVEADDDALFRVARAAAGSMRDGLSLLDQLFTTGRRVTDEEVVELLGTPPDERTACIARAIADGDAAAALGELNRLLADGVELSSIANALAECFRNMLIASTCGADSKLIELPEAQKKVVGEIAGRFSMPALVQSVGIVERAARNLRTSSVARALMEAALVRLAEAEKFIDPASLIERLEALGGGRPVAGEKKNVAPAAPAGSAAAAGARPAAALFVGPQQPETEAQTAAAPPTKRPIRWEASWLRGNWPTVVERLAAMRKGQVAGLLRLATVRGFEQGVLRLGYDSAHESLRQRCMGLFGEPIAKALSGLAGQDIRCEYVSTGTAASEAAPPVARPDPALSTAEKNDIQKDPAVREVLDLFEGDVVDMRRDAPPARDAEDEGEEENNEEA